MKKNKKLFKVILLTLLIIICNSCISYASNKAQDSEGARVADTTEDATSDSDETSTTIGLPDLDDYEPVLNPGTNSITVISNLLGVLTVVGIIGGVVAVALIGFNTILGSASEKAVAQEKFVGIIVASVIISLGSILARIIINIAESI